MPAKLVETRIDHHGEALPKGVYACATEGGEIVSYKVRWREEDESGVRGQRSKSFGTRAHGNLDRALKAALAYAEQVTKIIGDGGAIAKPDPSLAMTVEDIFKEWVVLRAVNLSREYAENSVRIWDRDIATRQIAKVRADRLSADPGILVRFQDQLIEEGLGVARRRNLLKLLRSVLRWSKKRHPNALRIDLTGSFDVPPEGRGRLAYVPDAVGVERIIEAILDRPAHDDLLPLRDAAFAAAMGYTIATRPSEWRRSAAWEDLHDESVEMQRAEEGEPEDIEGLKEGAHGALLLANARLRIDAYRSALEERYGSQPGNGLVFQVLDPDMGPVWVDPPEGSEPIPLAMDRDAYNRWTGRVWRPACEVAAMAPDAEPRIAKMRFYDLRHFAISLALHSTLVMTSNGMNLHPLSGWSGHDIQTLQEYYAHIIARYRGQRPIDLDEECERARAQVESSPFKPEKRPPGPQTAAARRRRTRRRAAAIRAPG